MTEPVSPKRCTASVLSPTRLPVLLGKSPFSECNESVIQVGPCTGKTMGRPCGKDADADAHWRWEGPNDEEDDPEDDHWEHAYQGRWIHAELAGGPCGECGHARRDGRGPHSKSSAGVEFCVICLDEDPDGDGVHPYVPTEWVEREGVGHDAEVA